MNPIFRRAALAALALTLAACASDGDLPQDNPFRISKSERELRLEAGGLYKLARRSLDSADYAGALERYNRIQLRYPFTDFATQAQLESIYARHRSFDADGAIGTADRFLKEHPRHAAVDYVYYLRGLVNFQRTESFLETLVDSSQQDIGYARRAFDDFALLTQRYPKSRYLGDARMRMVYLRNRIAAHELSIVKYYVRRGAHIAAARRAEAIITDYPGAPATAEALVLLEGSYRDAGLMAQADEVRQVREANPAVTVPEAAPQVERPGGMFGPPPDPIPEPTAK
ncbi:MAG: outer membrane protein assembly factor BamD [Gammaproteobacteria bacterium]